MVDNPATKPTSIMAIAGIYLSTTLSIREFNFDT